MELAEINIYILTFKHGSILYNVIGSTPHVTSPRKPTEDFEGTFILYHYNIVSLSYNEL